MAMGVSTSSSLASAAAPASRAALIDQPRAVRVERQRALAVCASSCALDVRHARSGAPGAAGVPCRPADGRLRARSWRSPVAVARRSQHGGGRTDGDARPRSSWNMHFRPSPGLPTGGRWPLTVRAAAYPTRRGCHPRQFSSVFVVPLPAERGSARPGPHRCARRSACLPVSTSFLGYDEQRNAFTPGTGLPSGPGSWRARGARCSPVSSWSPALIHILLPRRR